MVSLSKTPHSHRSSGMLFSTQILQLRYNLHNTNQTVLSLLQSLLKFSVEDEDRADK